VTHHVSPSERIAVLDVLRAFALLGIIITHASGSFLAGPPPSADYNIFTPADRLVATFTNLLATGKFFSIFAFLFGLSFAIQLDSAARKGNAFAGRFAWRLLLLLGIGAVHNLFYSGDILIIYALLGFLLIPVRKVRTGVLLAIALLLVTNLPGLVVNLRQAGAPPPTTAQQASAAARANAIRERSLGQFEIKRAGSAAELIEMNVKQSIPDKYVFQVRTGRLWITFGLFLLGMCAGRMNLFRESDSSRAFFRRLGIWTGGIALATSALIMIFPPTRSVQTFSDAWLNFASSLQQLALAAFYVCAVTLLFWRKPARGLLPALAPMGKMGLTTYLTQTVFGLFLFYGIGLGLLGKLGVAPAVMLCLAFFVIQVFAAQWWLQRFSMGPVEWLWRTLTYFKIQTLNRKTLPA
jgi:uncharacterized protein